MIKEPLVSILMPAYNAEKFIGEAMNSIIAQSYANWELLILNDGSTDKTKAIIEEFSDARIKYFDQPKNLGYLSTCNSLFQCVKGDFTTFLDADDTCSSNRISDCLQLFNDDAELAFITTDFARTAVSGMIISSHDSNIDYTRYSADPNYMPTVCCATIFLRTKLLNEAGGYPSFFSEIGGEDYHWLFRLSRLGKGQHLQKQLYNYRMHSGQSHNLNQNPLKYFYQEIDREIRVGLISNGIDLLEKESDVKKRWMKWVSDNPSELKFKQASSLLNKNLKKVAIKKALSALKITPLSLTSWHQFLYLTYSALRR